MNSEKQEGLGWAKVRLPEGISFSYSITRNLFHLLKEKKNILISIFEPPRVPASRWNHVSCSVIEISRSSETKPLQAISKSLINGVLRGFWRVLNSFNITTLIAGRAMCLKALGKIDGPRELTFAVKQRTNIPILHQRLLIMGRQ